MFYHIQKSSDDVTPKGRKAKKVKIETPPDDTADEPAPAPAPKKKSTETSAVSCTLHDLLKICAIK